MDLLNRYNTLPNMIYYYKLFKSKKIAFGINDSRALEIFIRCLSSLGYHNIRGRDLIETYSKFIHDLSIDGDNEGYMTFYYHEFCDVDGPSIQCCSKDHDCHDCSFARNCLGRDSNSLIILDYDKANVLSHFIKKGVIK